MRTRPSRAAAITLATTALAAIAGSACSGTDGASAATTASPVTSTTTNASTSTTSEATTTTTVPVLAPLTGLPAGDPTALDRPALVVKIDNHPDAMPQAGLSEADVVFEELVEGISRFAVVFHAQAPYPVGPIRSARTSDPDIIAALGVPLFAWSGGNAVTTQAISRSDLVDVGYARSSVEGGYFRERSRRAPHNLYADARALFALASEDQAPPEPLFSYRDDGEAGSGSAQPAAGVKVVFSGTQALFEWDAGIRGWARTQYGKAHVDAGGDRTAPANVVVLFTQYRRSPADPISPEAVTTGEGAAWVFTDGNVVEGTWSRPDAAKPAELRDAAGAPIELTPGQTWVALAQEGKAAIVPAGTSPGDVPWPR